MMKRTLPLLLLLLASPVQALKLVVWDNEMQTKVGAGESSGNRFNVQLVKDYSGPVKVLFSQSADEKARGQFPGLQSSYDGLLKNGQLSLLVPEKVVPDKNQRGPASLQNATEDSQSLSKFLQQYKLNLVGAANTQGSGDPSFILPPPGEMRMGSR